MPRSLPLLFLAPLVGLGGCLSEAPSQGGGAPEPNAVSGDLTQMTAPMHGDAQPWQYVPTSATGIGACAAVPLATVLDQIRAGFPAVTDITNVKTPGPVGVTVIAGTPTRAGDPAPPADGVASYIVGLRDDRMLGAVFFRGAACSGESCRQRENWSFETDEACRPRWVGYTREVDVPDGPHGPCVEFQGASPWNSAGDPSVRSRCDCDWSPQNIAGPYDALSLIPPQLCGSTNLTDVLPIHISITQGADLAQAEIILTGTGISYLDGRPFAGSVERQHFTATLDEVVTADCSPQRHISVQIDFEGIGIPGEIGLVDSSETPIAGCMTAKSSCQGASFELLPSNGMLR